MTLDPGTARAYPEAPVRGLHRPAAPPAKPRQRVGDRPMTLDPIRPALARKRPRGDSTARPRCRRSPDSASETAP